MKYFESKVPFYKLKVCMKSNEILKYGNWITSAIRGSFGNKLISLCCDGSNNDCINCNILSCSAKKLYGTASPEDSSQQFNPYVFYCPIIPKCTNTIEFYITLFGHGTETINDVLKVLSTGLDIKGHKFELTSIIDVFSENAVFDGYMWITPTVHYPNFDCNKDVHKLRLNFISPFNSKQLDRLISFDYILRASMRRTSSVLNFYGIECMADYTELLRASQSVLLTSADIHLVFNNRFSNRTKLNMSIKGYIGTLSFDGDITQFMPFLKFCQLVGIGKLCVMGFGQFEYVIG